MHSTHITSAASSGTASHRSGPLVLWDDPNMRTTLQELGGSARAIRFELGALARWAALATPVGDPVEVVMFTNIPGASAERLQQYIHAVRGTGVAVFAKPKRGDSDIDDDLVAAAASAGWAGRIVVATHDKDLIDRVRRAAPHARIDVLAIRELSRHARQLDGVGFIDVEEICGLTTVPVPRPTCLTDLPTEGRRLEPTKRLVGTGTAALGATA